MLATTFTVVISATVLPPAAGRIHGEFSLAQRSDGQ